MARALTVLALLLALTGCAIPATPTPPGAAPTVAAGDVEPAPVAVEIPAIGAASTLIPLGLDTDGALAVPPLDQPMQAGWFELGVEPGQLGPAVIAAHTSGRDGAGTPLPGLFARLHEVAPGDQIVVERADAAPLTWSVTEVGRYDKDAFPTHLVYGDVDEPALRLITCIGDIDPATRSHVDNLVVYAVLA